MIVVATLAGAASAWAAPVDDDNGKEWRQLYETAGLSWNQVSQVCPRDGATRCSGSVGGKDLTGWVWATDDQVVAFMGVYEPAILSADPPAVGGADHFGSASAFLADMRWTFYVSLYGSYTEFTRGWASSTDDAGTPTAGHVGYGWWPPGGSLSVTATPDENSSWRGVFLWRPSDEDHTGPAITPTVTGTTGSNGWYVSDVAVVWDVQDAESPVSSQVGCEQATVTSDTAATTFSCQATSAGGTSTASVVVKRDATAPTLTCANPAPVFEIYRPGAFVTAAVTDATSGPSPSPPAQALANTNAPGSFSVPVTGADRAGNRTTRSCAYQVVIPTCNGLTPTHVGTGANNIINGTSGRDVLVGLGGADTINGLGGDDVICGGDGPDTIDGGDGDDWIDGGASNDSIRGGNGRDACTSGEVRMSSCEA